MNFSRGDILDEMQYLLQLWLIWSVHSGKKSRLFIWVKCSLLIWDGYITSFFFFLTLILSCFFYTNGSPLSKLPAFLQLAMNKPVLTQCYPFKEEKNTFSSLLEHLLDVSAFVSFLPWAYFFTSIMDPISDRSILREVGFMLEQWGSDGLCIHAEPSRYGGHCMVYAAACWMCGT